MIQSVLDHDAGASIWVLVLGGDIEEILRRRFADRVTVVSLVTFEGARPDLAALKHQRNRFEYFFSMTPGWLGYVMDRAVDDGDYVTYLDADMWFFSDPRRVAELIGHAPVALVPHRFPRTLRSHRKYGEFNVGWVSFRNVEEGRQALTWWDQRCVEWCFDRVEGDKFADQGYLNRIPAMFPGTAILDDPGVNLAPWNVAGHRIVGPPLEVDGEELMFFHFHGLRKTGGRYLIGLWRYHAVPRKPLKTLVYAPYVSALEAEMRRYDLESGMPRRSDGLKSRVKDVASLLTGDYVRVPAPRP